MVLSEAGIDVSKLSALKAFCSFFQEGESERLARESGFIQRSSSRLTGEAFLKMLVENSSERREWSLTDQCSYLWDVHGIALTKQSLDERYHTFAVAFVKQCYQHVLAQSLGSTTGGMACSFSGIYLTDSTSFQLPAHLSPFYQGNGGDTSEAVIKLHQTIELLCFQVKDLQLCDGKQNDVVYWSAADFSFGENNLWIADLGHYSFKVFRHIEQCGSYFLSRYKTGTVLYVKTESGCYEKLDGESYLNGFTEGGAAKGLQVYFACDNQKVKARLIAEAVPEQVRQQRLLRYEERCRRQSKAGGRHWQMSAKKRVLCGYNLYLTSAPEEQLPDEMVQRIYALRWQIELLFKIWKSLLHLDNVGEMNICRFECFLYGRLLFVLLSTELLSFLKEACRDEDSAEDIEVSEWKAMKLIKKSSFVLSQPL